MSVNRRQLLKISGLAVCSTVFPHTIQAKKNQPALPVPPLLEAKQGQPLFLKIQNTYWAFLPHKKTATLGINGQYLGPTVRVRNGDDVKLVYANYLNESISMTVSGLLAPGPLMGGPARLIPPGKDWSPVIPIRQTATTCWYHANTPNHMASHIYQGIAGLWIIEDQNSRQLALPNHYGVDDFPLIIQDKRLSNFGMLEYSAPDTGGFMGDRLLVNGVQNPFLEVSRGWVRLRLLNASNSRRYLIRLNDGSPVYVISSDLGFLPMPVPVIQLSLAPGERREILIDMTQGKEKTLTAGDTASWLERLRGLFEPSDWLISTNIVTLRPTGLLPLVTDKLPMQLSAPWAGDQNTVRTREFRLGDNIPGINGLLWDRSRVDLNAQQGTWERWKIQATRPQSFHIQGVSFLIKKINGAQPLLEDQGWKDTVWVDGEVELNVYFSQPTTPQFPFLYYSQTLEIADRGAIGQINVQENPNAGAGPF